jgi:acyl carrier protein
MLVRWSQFLQQFTPDTVPPLLTELAREAPLQVKEPLVQQIEFVQRLEKALPRDRKELLVAHLRDQVVKVLRLSPSHPLDAHQGFFDLGMDSLTSVELRNCLQTSFGRSLASTLIFDYPTINALAGYLAREMFSKAPTTDSPEVSEQPNDELAIASKELESLSEEDAEALLLQELESISY